MPRLRLAFRFRTPIPEVACRPGRGAGLPTGCPACGGGGGEGGAPGDRRPCADVCGRRRTEPRGGGLRSGLLPNGAAPAAGSRRGRFRARDTDGRPGLERPPPDLDDESGGLWVERLVSIPLDDQVRDHAETMLIALNGRALHARAASGLRWHAVHIEFNGRAWGSMALSRAVGLEYPAWAVAQALWGAARRPSLQRRRRAVRARHLGREIVHLLAFAGPPFNRGALAFAPADASRGPLLASGRPPVQLATGRICGAPRGHRVDRFRRDSAHSPPQNGDPRCSSCPSDWSYDGRWTLLDLARSSAIGAMTRC